METNRTLQEAADTAGRLAAVLQEIRDTLREANSPSAERLTIARNNVLAALRIIVNTKVEETV